jgi:YD repeat-containing protein
VTDEATGLKTEYHYDRLPEGIADPDPDVPDHLLGRRSGQTVHLDADTRYTTATTYYPDGQVKSSTDARGHTTFFDYTPTTTTITDALDRQTVSISSDQYLPLETRYADGTRESQTYLFGNNLLEAKDYPTSLTDRNQRDRLFDYDELGRLKTATDWGNTLYQFRYKDNGYAVESPTGETLLSYEYNDDGDLNTVTYLDGGTRELTYSETDNRLEKAVLPSGFEVDYDYTASGLEQQRTVSFNGEVAEEVVSD